MSKYKQLDRQMFQWLIKHRSGVTTAKVFTALDVTDLVSQRHIQRRFTQLEDKGVLVCKLKRTMRVCEVVKNPPETLSKKKPVTKPIPTPVTNSIPAEDSNQFEQAGGKILRLTTQWDNFEAKPVGALLGFHDYINSID